MTLIFYYRNMTRKHQKNTPYSSTRQDIIKAAVFLFATKGIDGTSMKNIGKAANISDAAIYKHFTSKKNLVQSIFIKYFDYYTNLIDSVTAKQQPFRTSFQQLMQHFFESHAEDPFSLMLLRQHHEYCIELMQNRRRPLTAMEDFIKKGIESGALPEQNATITATLLLGALTQLSLITDSHGHPTSLAPHAEDLKKRFQNLIGLL